jgi:hypothetical protein
MRTPNTCPSPTARRIARRILQNYSSELFLNLIDQYKGVDKMIASAERRRDETFREIERRREHLARRLRKVSDEIIDDKASELA